ncbi:MAG: hypothetical protein IJN81_11745 [Clostridia bacterium]|nr:hypothetical protein [Clostridia bacterium]
MKKPFIISFFGESHIETLKQMAELENKIGKYLSFILEGEESVALIMTNYDGNVFDLVAFLAADWLRILKPKVNLGIYLLAEKPCAERKYEETVKWFEFDKQLSVKEGCTNDYITRAKILVDVADRIVCYVNENTSDKVAQAFDYAVEQNKKIINFGNKQITNNNTAG